MDIRLLVAAGTNLLVFLIFESQLFKSRHRISYTIFLENSVIFGSPDIELVGTNIRL